MVAKTVAKHQSTGIDVDELSRNLTRASVRMKKATDVGGAAKRTILSLPVGAYDEVVSCIEQIKGLVSLYRSTGDADDNIERITVLDIVDDRAARVEKILEVGWQHERRNRNRQ